jgi:hypothetical protein
LLYNAYVAKKPASKEAKINGYNEKRDRDSRIG